MMDTIARFADDVHIYSIDELFARFDKPLNHESWLSLEAVDLCMKSSRHSNEV
jgi:nucleotidyltransferase/DNA polymerase involved in DNA repair